MICEACGGDGELPVFANTGEQIGVAPCPMCGGCGLSHCCEGERPDESASEIR